MKCLGIVFFILFNSQSTLADTFISRIHSIAYGENKAANIVKFDNGRVGFVKFDDRKLIQAIDIGRKNNLDIEAVLDNKYYIISAQSYEVTEPIDEIDNNQSVEPYKPSILRDYNSALNVLNRMRRDYTEDGQCYNRAHVWAYEEFRLTGLRSMKLFLFFTNRFIRTYNFHWWFHVTPMTYVGQTMRTLDARYAKGPAQTKAWSDIFIKNKRACPFIKTFAKYVENQEREDCYLLPVSMYFVIPRDIERRDLTGIEKVEFMQKDLDRAYRDAFDQ